MTKMTKRATIKKIHLFHSYCSLASNWYNMHNLTTYSTSRITSLLIIHNHKLRSKNQDDSNNSFEHKVLKIKWNQQSSFSSNLRQAPSTTPSPNSQKKWYTFGTLYKLRTHSSSSCIDRIQRNK